MGIVHAKHERPLSGEVGCEPVQTMQGSRARVDAAVVIGHAKRRQRVLRSAAEQRPAFLRRCSSNRALEELTRYPERETLVKLGCTCLALVDPPGLGALLQRGKQRRLTDSRRAFQHHHATPAPDYLVEKRPNYLQLSVPLE